MAPGRPAVPRGPGGPAEPGSPGGPMGPGGPLLSGKEEEEKKPQTNRKLGSESNVDLNEELTHVNIFYT